MEDQGAAHCQFVIVDDNAQLRYLVAVLTAHEPNLELLGEAGDGRSGIELLETLERSHRPLPNIVVLDLDMPSQEGCETAREIRARWPELRIVVWTAHDPGTALTRVGIDDAIYIKKGAPHKLMRELQRC